MIKAAVSSSTTSSWSGSWVESNVLPRLAISPLTHTGGAQHVVFLQGRYVEGPHGRQELTVSVEPSALERKLAIREMRSRFEGMETTTSTTASWITSRR